MVQVANGLTWPAFVWTFVLFYFVVFVLTILHGLKLSYQIALSSRHLENVSLITILSAVPLDDGFSLKLINLIHQS